MRTCDGSSSGSTIVRARYLDSKRPSKSSPRRSSTALRIRVEAALDKTIRCQTKDTDRYGRTVAECFVQGQSVNAWMVRSGWAVAYRQYANAFSADERIAQQQRRNIWQGAFQMPADYRRDRKARAATARQALLAAPSHCRIKGNISSNGNKIFHVPGQRDYVRTRISPRQGECFFCSVTEATAAGWRPAQR
ncbi:succinoglycan biosynthesis protein [Xanthomonas oryzae pv. oryzicola BLS256]|uniref:Succinoglycan biosynthesis protein n=1 Tax=Xanthomonas oryzae pv. oryzicola (strain BLS256) TaxID=383407 RepID=G7TEA9_XANOB|nr:succinoglycan biosynthesis protein [Xanthomonas oryzae pv. oryzicola BLS256]